MRMTRKQLDLWLEALRSGKFIQGRQGLKAVVEGVTKHCCLGVLCELYKELANESFDSFHKEWSFGEETTVLPLVIANRFEAQRNGGDIPVNLLTDEELEMVLGMGEYVRDYPKGISLAGLNDRGIGFVRIAELLEKVVEIVEEVPA